MYAVHVCETVTGRYVRPLDATVRSWKRELNGSDIGSVELAPGALTLATRDQLRLVTTPQFMSLVIEWLNPGDAVGTPVFAGPILNRPWDGKTATINAVGIRSILDRRKLITPTPPYASQKLTFQNMSLGSIAVKVVQAVTSAPGYALPITYPAVVADTDPTHIRNYYGFNLTTAGTALDELTGVINGPDIDLQPVWADANRSAINYNMRVGTTAQPKLYQANQIVFDATQPQSSVQLLTYLDDASNVATRQWGNGSGTDIDTLMSTAQSATLTDAGWPVLEQQTDHKSDLIQSSLDQSVQGDLAAAVALLVQFGLTVDATAAPVLGSYLLGDQARVNVRNHLWAPDADYAMRIIAMDGDATTSVKLSVQGA